MAFVRTDLSLMASSAGNNIWFYRSNDTLAVIDTADYFLTAIDYLNAGDAIFLYADIDGTPAHGLAVVNSNTGTAIDTADATALAAADTD